jgi:hypothetical protein
MNKLDAIKARQREYDEALADVDGLPAPTSGLEAILRARIRDRFTRARLAIHEHAPTDLAALVKAVEEVRALADEMERNGLTGGAGMLREMLAPLLTTPERTAP